VYFPDWAGNLFAVRANNGRLLWSRKISDYNDRPGSISRVSPAIFGDQLIIGDNGGASWLSAEGVLVGAHIIAIDRHSGALRWITQVDAHPAALITGSPVFHGSTVYVGVSSQEEGLATDPSYPCCTFRGSIVALDAFTGAILWKTFTVPDNGGQRNLYSGGAVWAPPAIDPRRGSLFTGVGNNYTVPEAVLQCQQEALANGTSDANCAAPDDHFDSVLALDMNTGAIKWATGQSDPVYSDCGATVIKNYHRVRNPVWVEHSCAENNDYIFIEGQTYHVEIDGKLGPSRPGQPPPDLRHFNEAQR